LALCNYYFYDSAIICFYLRVCGCEDAHPVASMSKNLQRSYQTESATEPAFEEQQEKI